jgi:hypothetical protein
MEAVQNRQRSRHQPEFVRVEDVIPAEILDSDEVDREYLARVFRHPRRFLPPPRLTPKPAPEPDREPEPPFARRAKLAGLVLAAGVLASAIVIASTKDVDGSTSQASWAAALSGFALPAASAGQGGAGNGAPGASQQAAPSSQQRPDAPAAQQAPSAQPAPGAPQSAKAPESELGTAEKIAAVRAFYRTVDNRPKDALSLLDPLLTGKQPDYLVGAWQQMDSIEVTEAQVQPDGTVLAVVTMTQKDGVHLRLTQSLHVANGTAGIIDEIRLLSAERLNCSGHGDCQ